MDTLPRSLMQLLEIARFEIGYRLRRASTWFFAVLLIVLPLVVLQALASEPQHLNSPLSTATAVALIAMVGMLVTAAIFGDAATRDADTGMRPLFYTAPLGKLEYLGGRFLGALVVNAGLLFFIPIALLLGTFLPYENVTFGPFIPGAYIEPIVTFALPNLIFTAAILFTVAALTRSTLPAYLAAVGLFIAYLIAVQWARRLASRELAMLFDPFGSIVIQHLTGYLSPVEKDTVRLGLPPILLFNRLLWVAIGGAVLAFLAKRFQFELGVESGHRRKKAKGIFTAEDAEVAEERQLLKAFPKAPAVEVLSASSASSAVKNITQTLSIARIALTEIIASRTFRLVLAVAVIMVFAFGWDVGSIVFDTSTWPLTHLVASVMRGPAAMTVVVLIAVYAGELIWRERDVRVASMADTTPVATWVPLAGKFLALIGMLLVLQTTFLVSGLLLQVVRGYYVFELGLYIKFLFGFLLATYVLFAALAVAAHVVVDRKHLGHIVVALFFAFFIFGTEFTLSHNLLRYGSDPGWVYSDMNGFGPFVSPFIWFKLYWGAWALLLGVIAALLYVRGAESGWRQRIAEARLRLSGGVVRAAVVAVVLIAALGGFIFYNTTVLNEYSTDDEENAAAAEYEKRFGVYRDAPVPVIVDAKLRVDIHPERAEVDLAGTYTMVNRTTRPIDSVHVVVNRNVKARSIELDRTAQLVMESARRHLYRIYALERALVPGDTLRLTFDHRFERRGFPNSGINTSVAENGAYFDRNWLPRIGYEDAFELTDEYERKKHGLTPRTAPGLDDPQGMNRRYESRDADAVSVDAVIGTAEDQIAITPGTLVREWRENGRRYFHYKTDSPLMFGVPVLSARYAVREDTWNDVALKIFHHPTHTFNLDRMIRSMKASLEYFSREYGPYQFGELRIVEFPRYASFARAHPHTIAYSEGGAFLTRVEEGDVDRPFFVTAHEIAHQWWGGQLSGARVPGVGMISETLAQYGAMMVMEKTYGRDQVKKFYDFELDGYLRARGVLRGNDVPLIRVWDQSFIYYNKGAVAMYTLKEQIGEERVNAALRAFLNTHRDARPPYATSRDLYRELQAVTPDSLQDLLVDLFETITLWDVRVKSARAEQTGPSSYRVAMDVVGKKVRADSMGVETEVPMNDIVEIAVFAGNERPYFEKHRIRSGEQRITLTVSRKPESVGVDPYHDLIQRVKDGKVVSLDEVSATPWKAEYRARSYDSTRVRIPLPNF